MSTEKPTTEPVGTDEATTPATMSRGELQDKAIRGAMWTLLHVAVSLPLAFVVNIVIARVLGVVDYGRLAYLSTVLIIVAMTIDLGVGTGSSSSVPRPTPPAASTR